MRVSETTAGRQLRAYVVLDGQHELAIVQARLATAGRVLVNVFNVGSQAQNPDAIPDRCYQIGRARNITVSPEDRVSEALEGLTVAGIRLDPLCWQDQLRAAGYAVVRAL